MTVSSKTFASLGLTSLSIFILAGCSDAPAQTQVQIQTQEQIPSSVVQRPVQIMRLGDKAESNSKQFSGVLEASQAARLAFRVPGTIEKILVKTGDKVVKGQVLARLDPHDYQVTVVELEARLAEAKASHQLASAELARVKQAIADDAISQVNLDRAKSGYKRSLAMVDVVTQNLIKAQDALAYTELKAPFDGVIASQSQETFEQTSPGISLFSIHQPSQLKAVIDVPENMMASINDLQPVSVSWFGNDKPLTATFSEMNTLADPIKQTYTVQYTIDQANHTLMPGKSVTVSVDMKMTSNQYCIPYSALVNGGDDEPRSDEIAQGNLGQVYTLEQQKVVVKHIRFKAMQKSCVIAEGELKQGDELIVSGVDFLKPEQVIAQTLVMSASY
ncbi:efflux RND transporter periplasmic adaptor subunit [Shewanella sp. MBTL60-007]|uniref:efflux RND transporter periplasmic adaptor subunit n=1 Tax=Shewanella sp. MBTL60-007 TaxID=2815911 RepID=UPI001BBE1350|nr:efflux RND transporter periplasmic adaptor subunit [Shewanella sp. MBTL60-007]GIU26528.1 hemolysin D [Shewanella sp. MBTL60-007]